MDSPRLKSYEYIGADIQSVADQLNSLSSSFRQGETDIAFNFHRFLTNSPEERPVGYQLHVYTLNDEVIGVVELLIRENQRFHTVSIGGFPCIGGLFSRTDCVVEKICHVDCFEVSLKNRSKGYGSMIINQLVSKQLDQRRIVTLSCEHKLVPFYRMALMGYSITEDTHGSDSSEEVLLTIRR